jgi:hypothetical protein
LIERTLEISSFLRKASATGSGAPSIIGARTAARKRAWEDKRASEGDEVGGDGLRSRPKRARVVVAAASDDRVGETG